MSKENPLRLASTIGIAAVTVPCVTSAATTIAGTVGCTSPGRRRSYRFPA